jgi:hypothetical protein
MPLRAGRANTLCESGGSEAVQAGSAPYRLDCIRSSQLRKERRKGILARHFVSRSPHKGEPFAVVDRLAELSLLTKQVDRDLLESLPPEPWVEVVKPQLVRESERRFNLSQEPFVTRRLGFRVVSQSAKPIRALPGLADPQRHRSTLGNECVRRRVVVAGVDGSFCICSAHVADGTTTAGQV